MNITTQVDAKELERMVQKAPFTVISKLNVWVAKTTLRTERQMKQEVSDKTDTGRLQSGIHSSIGHLQGKVVPTAKHSIYVEKGRRPGSRMPPYREGSPLNSWARRRGIPPFLVARSIARKGIKPFPFTDRTYRYVKPLAERDATNTLGDIVRSL